MSESDAVWPFFVTCVLGLSLSFSESSLFFLSNFWTLPVTSFELDADADEPIDEPVALEPVSLDWPIDEPEPVWPVVEPLEPPYVDDPDVPEPVP
jgi:hypothetical protein